MKKSLGRILGVFMLLLVMGMTVCAADAVDIKKNRVFQVNSDVELHEQPDAASAVVASLPGGTAVIVKEEAQGDWCKVAYQEHTGYVQIAILGILGSPVVPAQGQEAQPAEEEAAQGQEAQLAEGEAVQSQEMQPADGAAQAQEADNETIPSQETQPSEESMPGQTENGNGAASIDIGALDQEFEVVRGENQQAFQAAETALEQTASSRMWGIVIGVLVVAIFAVGIVTTLVGNKGKKKEK